MEKLRKILLDEHQMPHQWYNIMADMPVKPLPPLHPGTRQPLGPQDMLPLFPMGLIEQEASMETFIDIPDEVYDIYRLWRPTPLIRASNFEKFLGTPAKIYFKYEGGSPSGSHKTNTAVAQAYYNAKAGVKKLTTETGAGQWGSALSYACQHFGIDLQVFMVKVSYEQKPFRKTMMQTWGASVVASPSTLTNAGRTILSASPDSPGSLGIAISEAVEMAVQNEQTKYSLGSVLNHVLLHQTVIGQEAIRQMEMAGEFPDLVVGCFGGGSNFGGISFPFLRKNFREGTNVRCIAVEPASCPKLTRGSFSYDFGDTIGMTPLIPMYTLGHQFVPGRIHAGGLRYHGAGAIVSQLLKDGHIEARSVGQLETFQAAVDFARAEGYIPAPETAHAIAQVVREANQAREEGLEKVILFNFSGHGMFDLAAYDQFLAGQLEDYTISDREIQKNIDAIRNLQPEEILV
jgi:tryptophan synthase beta chain